ncbi:hypothetical protein M422DRAFT_271700 [Sphaerobolus stellatus SS14]|uniref:Uncharacterized protein n=1 Tax=Sphaerobolus stellatus (strain SS14) TaxID=990650 RepID=A0A0C9TZ88_SPHS4|nr:hypothetical protein M422DRAFT_271700 [Sphaerobolus stellatus SS14]
MPPPYRHRLQPFTQRRNALIISALATISFPSASSFSIFDRKDKDTDAERKEDKPYQVSLVLAVVVKKLVGNMIVKCTVDRDAEVPPEVQRALEINEAINAKAGVTVISDNDDYDVPDVSNDRDDDYISMKTKMRTRILPRS